MPTPPPSGVATPITTKNTTPIDPTLGRASAALAALTTSPPALNDDTMDFVQLLEDEPEQEMMMVDTGIEGLEITLPVPSPSCTPFPSMDSSTTSNAVLHPPVDNDLALAEAQAQLARAQAHIAQLTAAQGQIAVATPAVAVTPAQPISIAHPTPAQHSFATTSASSAMPAQGAPAATTSVEPATHVRGKGEFQANLRSGCTGFNLHGFWWKFYKGGSNKVSTIEHHAAWAAAGDKERWNKLATGILRVVGLFVSSWSLLTVLLCRIPSHPLRSFANMSVRVLRLVSPRSLLPLLPCRRLLPSRLVKISTFLFYFYAPPTQCRATLFPCSVLLLSGELSQIVLPYPF